MLDFWYCLVITKLKHLLNTRHLVYQTYTFWLPNHHHLNKQPSYTFMSHQKTALITSQLIKYKHCQTFYSLDNKNTSISIYLSFDTSSCHQWTEHTIAADNLMLVSLMNIQLSNETKDFITAFTTMSNMAKIFGSL